MALGKIKADTLEHSTAGSLDTQYVVKGSAKVWANYELAGVHSFLDSFNTSSITDNASGKSTIGFSSALSSVNYASSGLGYKASDSNAYSTSVTVGDVKTATSIKLYHMYTTAFYDMPDASFIVYGDLA